MYAQLFWAVFAATIFLLPLQGRAQTFTDNAANPAYANGYAAQGGSTPGFGAFSVVPSVTGGGTAGTFVFTATEAEGNNGIPAPSTIDSQGKSFGFFAHGISNGVNDPSLTITRSFGVPLTASGETFSLDFVTGYNDGGTCGVALTNKDGAVGSFCYKAGGSYFFNDKPVVTGYKTGALHLVYALTSPTSYSLTVTGAITYSGTGTFTNPITGFQVQDTNASNGKATAAGPDHNGYFNNLSVKHTSTAP